MRPDGAVVGAGAGLLGVYGITSSNRRFSLQNFDAKPLFRGGTLIMLR
jgi:hypothetical protein